MHTGFIGLPNLVRIKEAQDTINQTKIYNNTNKSRLPRAGQEIQRRYFPSTEDVCIFSENPEMTKNIQQGLYLCRQSGGVPEKLDVFITKDTDKKLEARVAGYLIRGIHEPAHANPDKRSRIIMRTEMPDESEHKIVLDPEMKKDWLASMHAKLYPIWDKNCYSGQKSHSFVHELGHHFHNLELHKKLNALFVPDRQWIADNLEKDFLAASPVEKLQQLSDYVGAQAEMIVPPEMEDAINKNLEKAGELVYKAIEFVSSALTPEETTVLKQKMSHDGYFATNSHEAVAEMFATMVGGKSLEPELAKIYKKYHGPILPLFKI